MQAKRRFIVAFIVAVVAVLLGLGALPASAASASSMVAQVAVAPTAQPSLSWANYCAARGWQAARYGYGCEVQYPREVVYYLAMSSMATAAAFASPAVAPFAAGAVASVGSAALDSYRRNGLCLTAFSLFPGVSHVMYRGEVCWR